MSDAAAALVRLLPRTTLVVGKGGVGKTTCAAALALRAASVQETLLLSTDPARALASVLDQPVGPEPTPVTGVPRLRAQMLHAGALRARFLERWGDSIRVILDRGTYLDEADIGPLVDTALPGGDEIFAALALAELMVGKVGGGRESYARIIVDTAPTGHTLRLLQLPRTFRALLRLLEAMQEKHRFMVRTLTRAYRRDAADAFLAQLSALVTALEQSLHDPARCAAVMVTNAQPLVLEETRRYLDELARLGVGVAAVVWNATERPLPLDVRAEQYVVPRLREWPIGRNGLKGWLSEVATVVPVGVKPAGVKKVAKPATRVGRSRAPAGRAIRAARRRAAELPPGSRSPLAALLRPLTIVAGKGGVGKTTVACVLALASAEDRRTLLVSTDPAPSLGDALAQAVPDADTPVSEAPLLFARQMDASAAFGRLRSEYESRVDALFATLVARGVDLAHDRAIARDLLSLAPPGIDEVYALSLLADALFRDRYERVVVDPAPTGHLLRLLEMPQLALAWTHQIMRLMLKYKDVAGLGDTARDLLSFAQSLRRVDALLRDAERCGVVLVTLDEPVVRDETRRLASELRERGIALSAVVRNRATSSALPVDVDGVQLEAPGVHPPPVGVRGLREFGNAWTEQRPERRSPS